MTSIKAHLENIERRLKKLEKCEAWELQDCQQTMEIDERIINLEQRYYDVKKKAYTVEQEEKSKARSLFGDKKLPRLKKESDGWWNHIKEEHPHYFIHSKKLGEEKKVLLRKIEHEEKLLPKNIRDMRILVCDIEHDARKIRKVIKRIRKKEEPILFQTEKFVADCTHFSEHLKHQFEEIRSHIHNANQLEAANIINDIHENKQILTMLLGDMRIVHQEEEQARRFISSIEHKIHQKEREITFPLRALRRMGGNMIIMDTSFFIRFFELLRSIGQKTFVMPEDIRQWRCFITPEVFREIVNNRQAGRIPRWFFNECHEKFKIHVLHPNKSLFKKKILDIWKSSEKGKEAINKKGENKAEQYFLRTADFAICCAVFETSVPVLVFSEDKDIRDVIQERRGAKFVTSEKIIHLAA